MHPETTQLSGHGETIHTSMELTRNMTVWGNKLLH